MPEISCSPNDLMALATCFDSIPAGMQLAVQTYLLQQIAGNTMTLNELMDAAKCFDSIPAGDQLAVQNYLLCQIANGNGGVTTDGLFSQAQHLSNFALVDDDADITVNFPNLITVSSDINITWSLLTTSLNFPLLSSIGGTLNILSVPILTSINLNSLTSVGTIYMSDLPAITSIVLPSLTTVIFFIEIDNDTDVNHLLTSISLPNLVHIGASALFGGNSALASWSAPNWVPTDGTNIDFAGDALNAASVELILRRCVLAGVTICTIDLSGGTNAGTASLNAQGQADVITLGAQLTINP